MNEYIPAMERLVEKGDQEAFLTGFKTFTAGCNQCHSQEGEDFIVVLQPMNRTSPVRF